MQYQQQHPQNQSFDRATLWTMVCGTLGGIYKAQSTPQLLSNLTLKDTLSIAAYAFVSAIIGYGGKKLIGYLFAKLKKD